MLWTKPHVDALFLYKKNPRNTCLIITFLSMHYPWEDWLKIHCFIGIFIWSGNTGIANQKIANIMVLSYRGGNFMSLVTKNNLGKKPRLSSNMAKIAQIFTRKFWDHQSKCFMNNSWEQGNTSQTTQDWLQNESKLGQRGCKWKHPYLKSTKEQNFTFIKFKSKHKRWNNNDIYIWKFALEGVENIVGNKEMHFLLFLQYLWKLSNSESRKFGTARGQLNSLSWKQPIICKLLTMETL